MDNTYCVQYLTTACTERMIHLLLDLSEMQTIYMSDEKLIASVRTCPNEKINKKWDYTFETKCYSPLLFFL